MVELESDIFVIPTSGDKFIVYSPLRGAAFYANSEAANAIRGYIRNGTFPEKIKGTALEKHIHHLAQVEVEEPQKQDLFTDSSGAIFILSQICNLGCSYCYAQNSHSKETLPYEKVQSVIDLVCAKNTPKSKSFSFIGGGEPLATWKFFKWSVEYIKKAIEKNSLSSRIGLTTNGTLLNQERVLFLKENEVVVSVSSEILPEIQNEQRPFQSEGINSFDRVHNGINLLITNGLIPRIRSTITKRNVSLMPRMVEFAIKNYPEIKALHFEPVTNMNENNDEFFRAYIPSFNEAKRIAKEREIGLRNSITHSFSRLRTRFCRGEFCITPSSDIVSCHRISSDRELSFELFKYGKVADNIQIDTGAVNRVLEVSEVKHLDCTSCFAKWHCAGGCPMYRVTSTEKEFLSYCTFVRDTIRSVLDEKLQRQTLNQ